MNSKKDRADSLCRCLMSPYHLLSALFLYAGMVAGFRATADGVPPPTGLVGWWPGDGNANDIASTNNGTLQGGATANAAGVVGQAFHFDGTNAYVQIPDSPVFHPTNLTVECWVRFDAYQTPGNTPYTNQQYIVFKQNSGSYEFEGFALTKDHDPQGDVFLWEVASAGGGTLVRIDSVDTVVTGAWYHVAGVRGSNFTQLYMNGHLEVQTNVNFPQNYGNEALYFGSSGESYYDRKLHGELDEVSLYNRALSSNEIYALYLSGSAGKCKGTNGIIITSQPQSQTAPLGGEATFAVAASGAAPLTYQWQFNNATIAGASSTNLSLTNVQDTNAGSYTVMITNPSGSVYSAAAMLTVVDRPLLQDTQITTNGLFAFTLNADVGQNYIIQMSSNLLNWALWTNINNLAGPIRFTNPISSNGVPQFYRAQTVQ